MSPSHPFDLSGTVAVVTGGNGGTRTPSGRWGHPDDLAGTAVFLASGASDFVTGSTICVDGGYAVC